MSAREFDGGSRSVRRCCITSENATLSTLPLPSLAPFFMHFFLSLSKVFCQSKRVLRSTTNQTSLLWKKVLDLPILGHRNMVRQRSRRMTSRTHKHPRMQRRSLPDTLYRHQ